MRVHTCSRALATCLLLEIGYPVSQFLLLIPTYRNGNHCPISFLPRSFGISDLRSRAAHKEFSPPLLSKQQSEEPVQPLLFLINDGSSQGKMISWWQCYIFLVGHFLQKICYYYANFHAIDIIIFVSCYVLTHH